MLSQTVLGGRGRHDQLPRAQRHVHRRGRRLLRHPALSSEVRPPAGQQGDDRPAGDDPQADRGRPRGQGAARGGRGRVPRAARPDRRPTPARIREEARAEGRAIIEELRPARSGGGRPRRRPRARSGSRPSASRSSPSCAPRWARSRSSSPGGSSVSRWSDDARQRRVVERFIEDLDSGEAAGSASSGEPAVAG